MRTSLPVASAVLAVVAASHAPASAQAPAAPPADPNDLLGNIVVVAGATRPLPRIAVIPSLASDVEDVTLRSVVRRDLDLSGEFDLLADGAAPPGLYLADSPIDLKAWRGKGVEALVKVAGRRRDRDHAELRAQVYFLGRGDAPVLDKRFSVPAAELREESHRLADLVIGALTGTNGGFASHMTFAMGSGGLRRVFLIDADGHDAKPVSPADESAIAPAFGKNGELYYAAAARGDLFRIRDASGAIVPMPLQGSVYGIAFSRDHASVAVSVGVGSAIKVFTGPDFANLAPASEVGMALHPAFTPGGKLVFAGEGRASQRIFVDGRPITADGLFASAPVVCNNSDGVRVVFAAGAGKRTDLVAADEKGGQLVRLTQNQGSNGYPACSPGGRLIAFFSTRTSGEGPGLYVMRIDGSHPKRIAPLVGDSLRWDALPPGHAVELRGGA